MNAKQKYLKDESGSIFSPIVSTDTIYYGNTNLTEYLQNLRTEMEEEVVKHRTLYVGNITVPSRASGKSVNITLNGSLRNWHTLLFVNIQRVSFINKIYGETFILDTPRPVAFTDISNWSAEFTNVFGFYVEKISDTVIKLSGSQLTTITADAKVNTNADYVTNINYITGLNIHNPMG